MSRTNFDQAELNKFNELADKWWDQEGPFKPLHEINPLRLAFIQQHINLTGKKIIDVGCGGGILSEALAKPGANVTGIDLAEDALTAAKKHLATSKLTINYQCISVETFAAQHAEQFDVLTCMEMLEHVPDPQSVINACAQLVKPGGLLFFSTINRNAKSYLYAIVGAEWILNLIPKGTHDYAKFIKPSELTTATRQAGLQLTAMQGITYSPLSRKYQLTEDVSVNYLIACEKNG